MIMSGISAFSIGHQREVSPPFFLFFIVESLGIAALHTFTRSGYDFPTVITLPSNENRPLISTFVSTLRISHFLSVDMMRALVTTSETSDTRRTRPNPRSPTSTDIFDFDPRRLPAMSYIDHPLSLRNIRTSTAETSTRALLHPSTLDKSPR